MAKQDMDVRFPLFVFEKDDRSMYLVETPGSILHGLDTIDIENEEYLFWDSTGAGVRILVTPSAVKRIELCAQTMSLQEAFHRYAETYRVRVIPSDSPMEIWQGFESQLPPRRPFWARLFRNRARFGSYTGETDERAVHGKDLGKK
jgi:hypothetical protein